MPVWLAKDPSISRLADRLACNRNFIGWLCTPVRASCQDSAHEHVSQHVVVSIVITGLLQLWTILWDTGEQRGEDLYLPDALVDTIDQMTSVAGFGHAMESAGWLQVNDDGLYFPGFFKLDDEDGNNKRVKARNRKRRQRERERCMIDHQYESCFLEISDEMFRSGPRMCDWFTRHRATLGLEESDLLKVFAMGILVSERGTARNPIAMFVANVAERRWSFLKRTHLARAQDLLAKLESAGVVHEARRS